MHRRDFIKLCAVAPIAMLVCYFVSKPKSILHVYDGQNLIEVLKHANDGDEIILHAGTYQGPIILDEYKSVTIIGEGWPNILACKGDVCVPYGIGSSSISNCKFVGSL